MEGKSKWLNILLPIASVVLAFIVGGIIILSEGKSPVLAYTYLFRGAIGTPTAIGETIAKATALIFSGLCFAFAYKSSMFNLGGEGQIIMGAIFACVTAHIFRNTPSMGITVLCLFAGVLGGMIWGAIPGLLKARRNVNEMISSILLNYIATLFMERLFSGPLKEANIPQTAAIPESMRIPTLIPNTRAHVGFILAIIVAIAVWYYLSHTYRGYSLRAVGLNPDAAEVNGFNVKRMIVFSFIVSGAIAGLGGAVELTGLSFRLQQGFVAGFGFDGVAIGLIGQMHPFGIILAAFLFAALRTGTNSMQIMTGIPVSVVDIIQAVIIIFVVASMALMRLPKIQQMMQKYTRRRAKNE